MKTVAELRAEGNKVKVIHRRWYLTDELRPQYFLFSKYELAEFCVNNPVGAPILGPESRGGITYVELTTPDNKTVTGVAQCSFGDNYNRRLGVNKSLGRALAQLKEKK